MVKETRLHPPEVRHRAGEAVRPAGSSAADCLETRKQTNQQTKKEKTYDENVATRREAESLPGQVQRTRRHPPGVLLLAEKVDVEP